MERRTATFADRLWWARHRAQLGATRLARAVKCSQSLISSLERNDAGHSKLTPKFAAVLGVDAEWLAHGHPDRAPEDFDEEKARTGRESMSGEQPGAVVHHLSPQARVSVEPRWAGVDFAPPSGRDALMKSLINSFMDFARTAGPVRTRALLRTFEQLAKLAEEVQGQNGVGAGEPGNGGTK